MTVEATKQDHRSKLSDNDKVAILALKGKHTQQKVADKYGVSRRTISFIWNPESAKKHAKRLEKRGGQKIYYNKEKHRLRMARYRKRKKEEKPLAKSDTS